ncbi:MAG TPA: WbqC family protein [Bacteroidia bacterium]|nr:WbqC family protein [Bacteroidia bacterium]
MTETVITSACYFPPAIFFNHFYQAEEILPDAHEYFVKQTLRNRAYVCGANGKFSLIVPVKHTGGKLTAMKDIQISYDSQWQKIHWRSITSAYRNSPFFEYYEDELAPLFSVKEKFLFDLNEKILHTLLKLTGCKGMVAGTEKFVHEYSGGETDIRKLSDPKIFFESLTDTTPRPYPQVFPSTDGFISGLSVLDLLFNMGRDSMTAL